MISIKRGLWIVFYIVLISLPQVSFGKDILQAPKNSYQFINEINYNKIYEKIYEGLKHVDEKIDLSDCGIKSNGVAQEVSILFNELLGECPEIFYVDNGSSITYRSNGEAYLEVAYTSTRTKILTQVQEVKAKVNTMIQSLIKEDMSDLEKEIAIHNALILNTAYDEEGYNSGKIDPDSYTIYGTLIKGKAVCDGYSKTFQYILNQIGIPCIRIISETHAWNIVNIDGNNYHVDLTWDDPSPDIKNYISYECFNQTDDYIWNLLTDEDRVHRWDKSKYPACTNQKYQFMNTMTFVQTDTDFIYYSDLYTNKVYKVPIVNLTQKIRLMPGSGMYLTLYKDTIYFSYASLGGSLYKIKTNGTGLTRIRKESVRDLYIKDNKLHYTVQSTGKENTLNLS